MDAPNQNIHHIYCRHISSEQGKQVKSHVFVILRHEVQIIFYPATSSFSTNCQGIYVCYTYRCVTFDQMLHFSLTVKHIYFDNVAI